MKNIFGKSSTADQTTMQAGVRFMSDPRNAVDIINVLRRDQELFDSATLSAKTKLSGVTDISLEKLAESHKNLLDFLVGAGDIIIKEIYFRILESSYVVSDPPSDVAVQIPRRLTAYALTVHKTDSDLDSNEDAFFIEKEHIYINDIAEGKTYAVSDGATSSPDAQQWARILAKHSAKYQSIRSNFLANLPEVQKEWSSAWEIRKSSALQATTSWWAETALDKPNAATYCSATIFKNIQSTSIVSYRSIAIGDSCLFHFRHGRLIKTFPIESPTGFSDRPQLVRSSGEITRGGDVSETSGILHKGDTLILATDAVAEWLMNWQKQETPIIEKILLGHIDESYFYELIRRERLEGKMKDDDSTIVVIGVR